MRTYHYTTVIGERNIRTLKPTEFEGTFKLPNAAVIDAIEYLGEGVFLIVFHFDED